MSMLLGTTIEHYRKITIVPHHSATILSCNFFSFSTYAYECLGTFACCHRVLRLCGRRYQYDDTVFRILKWFAFRNARLSREVLGCCLIFAEENKQTLAKAFG